MSPKLNRVWRTAYMTFIGVTLPLLAVSISDPAKVQDFNALKAAAGGAIAAGCTAAISAAVNYWLDGTKLPTATPAAPAAAPADVAADPGP